MNVSNYQPIKYGSFITLNLFQYPYLYLYQDSFMDNRISLRSFDHLHGNLFHDFSVSVFKVLPVMGYKVQNRIIDELVKGQIRQRPNLKARKQVFQFLDNNYDLEINGNASLCTKLQGTPILFITSTFHLLHTASLKFLQLNDENIENLHFDLVDFPNEKTVLRFNPCLTFQKSSTNMVYNSDVVVLSANYTVVNRHPNMFTNYQGQYYEYVNNEVKEKYYDEIIDSQIMASVDEISRWRVNFYSSVEEQMNVGDVLAFQLSEHQNVFLNTRRGYDTFERILQLITQEERRKFELISNQKIMSQKQGEQEISIFIDSQQSGQNTPINSQQYIKQIQSVHKQQYLSNQFSNEKQQIKSVINDDQTFLKQILIDDLQIQFQDLISKNNVAHIGILTQLPSSCFWKIEGEQHTNGGLIQSERHYRIRHFQTGRYLEFQNQNGEYIPSLTSKATKQTVYSFQLLQNGTNSLSKDSHFHLKHIQTGMYISFKEINEEKIHQAQAILSPLNQLSNTVFKVRKADMDDVWEARFLVFSLPLLIETVAFTGRLKTGIIDMKEKVIFYTIYKKMLTLLEQLETFVLNRMVTNMATGRRYYQECPHRQDSVRLQHILAILCWILFRIFPEREEFESIQYKTIQDVVLDLNGEKEFIYQIKATIGSGQLNKKRQEKLQEHHQKRIILLSFRIYQTINAICQSNFENQMQLVRMIDIFTKHIGVSDFVSENLSLIFRNNLEILQSFSKVQNNLRIYEDSSRIFIREIVNNITFYPQFKKPSILTFLSSLCLHNGEAIYANQEMVYKALIEDQNIKNYALMNIYNQKNSLMVEFYDWSDKLIIKTLEKFLQEQEGNPNFLIQYDYLKAQLELFSTLCKNRNFNAFKTFQDQFPSNCLVKLVSNQKIDEGIKSTLIGLLQNIYLDRDPNTIQVKPNLIRVLRDQKQEQKTNQININEEKINFKFQDEEDMSLLEGEFQEENEISGFIEGFKSDMLKYLQHKCELLRPITQSFLVYNELTLRVIKLIHMILKFGIFHNNFSEQSDKNLLMKLFDTTQRKNQTSEISILITCLAQLLEYDQAYFTALHQAGVKRKSDDRNPLKKVNQLVKTGFTQIGRDFQNFFTQDESIKIDKIYLRGGQGVSQNEQEKYYDPLFKKLRGLKKVLEQYKNKTYQSKQDIIYDEIDNDFLQQNFRQDFEVEIKLEICSMFSYLLDMRHDYLIDNIIYYLQETFHKKTDQVNPTQIKKQNYDAELISFLPENILTVGEDPLMIKPLKEYTPYSPIIYNFDQILGRPFLEVLMLAFYFAKNQDLENKLVGLLERYTNQKKEFNNNIENLQLLLTQEQKWFYESWFSITQKLKNYVQYSQIWLQLDTPAHLNARNEESLERALSKLWQIDSILAKFSNDDNQFKMRQSMFLNIGGYQVVNELIEKALSVLDNNMSIFECGYTDDDTELYKQDMAQRIMELFRVCFSILAYFAKNNSINQELVFRKNARILMRIYVNVGQVELINSLVKGNFLIVSQLKEMSYFVDLVCKHGKYVEFLNFYEYILQTSEDASTNCEVHKLVLQTLLNQETADYVYPFNQQNQRYYQNNRFYNHEPSINHFKQKYVQLLTRCLRVGVGVSLIQRCSQVLRIRDLTLYLLDKCLEMKAPYISKDIQFEILKIKKDIAFLLVVLTENVENCLQELFTSTKVFMQLILIESNWLQKQKNFHQDEEFYTLCVTYYIDTLLPLVNIYNEAFLSDSISQFIALDSQGSEIYSFAEIIMRSLSLLFFDCPQKIYNNHNRLKSLQRISKMFNIPFPKEFQLTQLKDEEDDDEEEDFNYDIDDSRDQVKIRYNNQTNSVQQNTNLIEELLMKDQDLDIQHNYSMMEFWEILKFKLNQSTAVEQNLKTESTILPQSVWELHEMFTDVKGDGKDLVLTRDDMLIRMLSFLQFSHNLASSGSNVKFILNLLRKILKNAANDTELYERQVLLDQLNATKIILVLFSEQDQTEEDLLLIMKFLIDLARQGNDIVLKTIYQFLSGTSNGERFFFKIKALLDLQVDAATNGWHLSDLQSKLIHSGIRVLQLLCEGHNNELQTYLRHQNNSKISYDLVTRTVQVLFTLKIGEDTYPIVEQCFKTIKEMVCGPCRGNQVAIANSKFLEFVVLVLNEDKRTYDQLPQQHKSSRFDLNDDKVYSTIALHPGRIGRIKFWCLVTVISLLEGCEYNQSLILQVMRTIPMSVLTTNLTRIYQQFKKYFNKNYTMELLGRYNLKIDNTNQDEQSEFIIENGFYIFTLIKIFITHHKGNENLIDGSDDILREFEDHSNDKDMLNELIKDNFIGGLTKLSMQLMSHGVKTMKQFKKDIIDKALKSNEELKQEEEIKRKLEMKELKKNALRFFKSNICGIEIVRNNILYDVQFFKPPFCLQLPEDIKDNFHQVVDRTSQKSKLTYLMQQADEIIKIMQHEERLRILFSYNQFLAIFANHGKLWEQCAFISTLILNFVICFSYSEYFFQKTLLDFQKYDQYKSALRNERLFDPRLFFSKDSEQTIYLIATLGIVNLVFNSLVVFFFLIKRAPLKVQFIWQPYLENIQTYSNLKKLILFQVKCFYSLYVLLQDFDILYYSVYILANIIGLYVHPFYFCFHLMDFFKIEQLKTVVQAIWYPKVELGLALLLMIVTQYLFSLVSYVYYYQDFDNYKQMHNYTEYQKILLTDNDNGYRNCDQLWECFINLIDQTFKNTGSVGAYLQDRNTINYDLSFLSDEEKDQYFQQQKYNGVDHIFPDKFISRFFYDNILNITVVFILLNMVLGIIIDTFGSLREKLYAKIEDQTQCCFICGISREKLDKCSENGKGFYYHIKNEHYMWNYLFYRASLIFKDKNLFSGMDNYVFDRLVNSDINWVPIRRAKCVQDEDDEERVIDKLLLQTSDDCQQLNKQMEKTQIRLKIFMES